MIHFAQNNISMVTIESKVNKENFKLKGNQVTVLVTAPGY